MTFLDSLTPYTDGNGLICPYVAPVGVPRGSDNGVLYTSQALILNKGLKASYICAVESCIDKNHQLHRSPQDVTEDAPDDYYGLLSMLVFLDIKSINISLPISKWQPVLVYLWLLNIGFPLACVLAPLVFLLTATSNAFSPASDTSNRLLTWTFCQALKKRTILPRLAALFWEWRQKRIYGSISNMFAIYFPANHPFIEQVKLYE